MANSDTGLHSQAVKVRNMGKFLNCLPVHRVDHLSLPFSCSSHFLLCFSDLIHSYWDLYEHGETSRLAILFEIELREINISVVSLGNMVEDCVGFL